MLDLVEDADLPGADVAVLVGDLGRHRSSRCTSEPARARCSSSISRNLKPRAVISAQRHGGDGRQILGSGKPHGECRLPGLLPFDARIRIRRFPDVDQIRQAVNALGVDRGLFGGDRQRWVRCQREVARFAGLRRYAESGEGGARLRYEVAQANDGLEPRRPAGMDAALAPV